MSQDLCNIAGADRVRGVGAVALELEAKGTEVAQVHDVAVGQS